MKYNNLNTYSDLNGFFKDIEDSLDEPILKNILKAYKYKYDNFDFSKLQSTRFATENERFKKYFSTGLNGQSYYNLTWNIDKLKEEIKKNNLTPLSIPLTEDLYQEAMNNDVEIKKISTHHQKSEPIIFVKSSIFYGNEYANGAILVDGNHRVVAASFNKEKFIQAYIVDEEIHMKTLQNEFDEFLYKMLLNISYLGAFNSPLKNFNTEQEKLKLLKFNQSSFYEI